MLLEVIDLVSGEVEGESGEYGGEDERVGGAGCKFGSKYGLYGRLFTHE